MKDDINFEIEIKDFEQHTGGDTNSFVEQMRKKTNDVTAGMMHEWKNIIKKEIASASSAGKSSTKINFANHDYGKYGIICYPSTMSTDDFETYIRLVIAEIKGLQYELQFLPLSGYLGNNGYIEVDWSGLDGRMLCDRLIKNSLNLNSKKS